MKKKNSKKKNKYKKLIGDLLGRKKKTKNSSVQRVDGNTS